MSDDKQARPTVQIDNERVRVTEWRFPPGGSRRRSGIGGVRPRDGNRWKVAVNHAACSGLAH